MAERILYLIRHGHYFTEDGIRGQLTELGRQQAELTAQALAHVPVTNITCSTWIRAEQTARIMAEYFPAAEFKRARALIEMPPLYAVTHDSAAMQDAPEHLITEGRASAQQPNGHGPKKLITAPGWAFHLAEKAPGLSPAARIRREMARADRAFERFFRATRGEDKHELLVCHGTLIRYFVAKVLGAPPEGWARMSCHNCGITRVAVVPHYVGGDQQVYLESYMEVGHLPPEMRTS